MSGRLRAALRLAAFVLFTLPLMPVQQLLLWLWPRGARWLPHAYHRVVALILGLEVRAMGEALQAGPCLIVANHVSWIDIVALSALAPVSFIAKREVAQWPFFGALARLQRTVFVDRERRHRAHGDKTEIERRLEAGDTLVLFPEGTSGDGASVLPFKSSLFGAADAEHLPIQPVTLAYSHGWGLPLTRRHRPAFAWYGGMELAPHLWQALKTGPLTVTVVGHPPLAAGTARKAAARQAEEAVRQGLYAALHGRGQLR